VAANPEGRWLINRRSRGRGALEHLEQALAAFGVHQVGVINKTNTGAPIGG